MHTFEPPTGCEPEAKAGDAVTAEPSLARQNDRVSPTQNLDVVVLIEARQLFRESLVNALSVLHGGAIGGYTCFEEWVKHSPDAQASVVLLAVPPDPKGRERAHEQLAELLSRHGDVPIVVVSDSEDSRYVVETLDRGARGCVTTNMPLNVLAEVLRLVAAGGTYVPASCLIEAQRKAADPSENVNGIESSSLFTARQKAVVEAIRRGKSNKQIAYELAMCESTVKVHVRNIMKRLKASNRTQVAYLANEILDRDAR